MLLVQSMAWRVNLRVEAVEVRLSLLDVGREMLVVVRLGVGCNVVSGLQISLTHLGRGVGEILLRGRAPEDDCDQTVPDQQLGALVDEPS